MSRSRVAFALALVLTVGSAAAVQAADTCVISPAAPGFEAGADQDGLHALPHPRAAAHTGFHGQGLHGGETLYLSHLAVFMGRPDSHPHNFQVLLEVSLVDPEARARLQADRAQHPDALYTVVPPMFDQAALVTDYPGRAPLRTFPGTTVFRGHFEQGGESILENVTVEVERVVHFREFLLGGARLATQHYLLFGREGTVLLAHLLSAPPDFDQILSAELAVQGDATEPTSDLLRSLLAQGVFLHLPDRENVPASRLRPGERLDCTLETGTRALPIPIELRITEERYCEVGEFTALVTGPFNTPAGCGT